MDIPVKLYDFGVKPPDPPIVRFGKKLADAKTARMDEKRAIDEASSTAIAEDMTKSVLHTKELEGKFGELQARLESLTAPKMQQQPLGLGDMIAIGASGLFGGAQGFSQAAHGVYQRHDEMQKQRYSEDLTNFKMQRENTMDSASRIQDQIEMEAQNLRMLRAKQIEMLMSEDDAKRQEARDNLKHIQEMEKLNAENRARAELEAQKISSREKIFNAKQNESTRNLLMKRGPSGVFQWAKEQLNPDGSRKYTDEEALAIATPTPQEEAAMAKAKETTTLLEPRKALIESQSRAWDALVPNREADTDLKRAMKDKIAEETRLMDDKVALGYAELRFKYEQLRYKGVKTEQEARQKANSARAVLRNIESQLVEARKALEARKKELYDQGVKDYNESGGKSGSQSGYALDPNDPAVEKVQALEKMQVDWQNKVIEAENESPMAVPPTSFGQGAVSGAVGGGLSDVRRDPDGSADFSNVSTDVLKSIVANKSNLKNRPKDYAKAQAEIKKRKGGKSVQQEYNDRFGGAGG